MGFGILSGLVDLYNQKKQVEEFIEETPKENVIDMNSWKCRLEQLNDEINLNKLQQEREELLKSIWEEDNPPDIYFNRLDELNKEIKEKEIKCT